MNFRLLLTWTEPILNWLELNNDTIVFLELLYNILQICLKFDEVCITDSVIFLFITVKLLWNNLYL